MSTSATQDTSTQRLRLRVRAAALAVGGGVLAAVLLWFAAVVLAGVDLRVAMGPEEVPVGLVSVITAAAVAGLLGSGLLAVLVRTGRRGVQIWRAVAVVALLLSLGGPLSSGSGRTVVAVLVMLHVAVAAVLVPLLPRAVQGR